MEQRLYILQAGNFKQIKGTKVDKWADDRWATLTKEDKTHKSFVENQGELCVKLSIGESILYRKGWGTTIDKEEKFTATENGPRFFKFK
jgi:hypothetical protein